MRFYIWSFKGGRQAFTNEGAWRAAWAAVLHDPYARYWTEAA